MKMINMNIFRTAAQKEAPVQAGVAAQARA
jgi:hypothetical protein